MLFSQVANRTFNRGIKTLPRFVSARAATSTIDPTKQVYVSETLRPKLKSIREYLQSQLDDGSEKSIPQRLNSQFQIISDFDHTMSHPDSDMCHGMVSSHCPNDEFDELSLSIFEESRAPDEKWRCWKKFHDFMIDHRFEKWMIPFIIDHSSFHFRRHCDRFLQNSLHRGVPFLVVSAGLSNIIDMLLRRNNLFLDNIDICANKMLFDDSDRLVSFSPLLSSYNKFDAFRIFNDYFSQEQIASRRLCLCFGDSARDVDAFREMDFLRETVSIGFVNGEMDVRVPRYLELFDIVLTKRTASLQIGNLLLDGLCNMDFVLGAKEDVLLDKLNSFREE